MKFVQAEKGSEIFDFIKPDTYENFKLSVDQLVAEAEKLRIQGGIHPVETYELIKSKLYKIFPDLFYGVVTKPDKRFNQTLWRCSNYSGLDPEKIDSFSFPPVMETGYRRCNIPQHPVLYLSDNFVIAASEMINSTKEVNNPYWISEWEVNHEIPYIITPFISNECSTSKNFEKYLEAKFADHPKTDFVHFTKMIDILQQYFRTPQEYLISSFLAHSFIYGKPDLLSVMFVYNSILSKDVGLNFACHPKMVNSILKLKTVIEMDFKLIEYEGKHVLQYDFKRVGKPNGDKVNWQNWQILPKPEALALSKRLFANGTMKTLS